MTPRARLLVLLAAALLAALPACDPGEVDEPSPTRAASPTAEAEARPKPSAEPEAGGIAWARSYDDALARGKEADKPVMVDLFTDWCTWCKRLDHVTYADPSVVELAERFVPLKLDAEKDGAPVVARYRDQVNGYPTILFLDPGSGSVVGAVRGYLGPADFADRMRIALDSYP